MCLAVKGVRHSLFTFPFNRKAKHQGNVQTPFLLWPISLHFLFVLSLAYPVNSWGQGFITDKPHVYCTPAVLQQHGCYSELLVQPIVTARD